MEISALLPTIQNFFKELNHDEFLKEHSQTHQFRAERAYKLLQADALDIATKEQIQAFLKSTDAWFGVRSGQTQFWKHLFGSNDEKLPELRSALKNLVVRADQSSLSAKDINELKKTLPGIGPAFLSEILTLRFPEKYWMLNRPVREFLAAQQIDIKSELPQGKKSDAGEEYITVGRHLSEIRNALSKQAGKPVDFLLTDLFVYWTRQNGAQNDEWEEKINTWKKDIEPKRLEVRTQGEQNARLRIVEKLGKFDEQELRAFAQDLSADWFRNGLHPDRFKPAFYGPQVNMLVQSLDAFNIWIERFWSASDDALDELLDEFWSTNAVFGGGITLPTAILYLKDPQKYNIWLVNTTRGLQIVTGYQPGAYRTASSYRHYNQAMNEFRSRHKLAPQMMDLILWMVTETEGSGRDQTVTQFTGFSPDTFKFLQELKSNNSEDWMHANNNANMERYKEVLREPLRTLFAAVAPAIQEMDSGLETEAKVNKVLAALRKRFPDEEGAYHPYLWGAFYRKGRTKQTDCQLFINVHPEYLDVGLNVAGAEGSEILDRFQNNLKTYPEIFLYLLKRLPDDVQITVAPKHGILDKTIVPVKSADDLQPLLDNVNIDIARQFEKDDPILSSSDFVQRVKDLFLDLYPLYRFATGDADTIKQLIDVTDGGEEEEPTERYSIENLYQETYLPEEFWSKVSLLLEDKGQIIFYGPPGTGKTWVAEKFAKYWVEQAKEPGGDAQVVQFHPSYAYEEFVEGIRPDTVDGPNGTKQITYPVRPGIFRRLCDEARQHPNRRYVLIIDEINRGELPRIFGELLFLLEYRKESVLLPYSASEGEFGIPSNVFLIGTMNTADRSIALVDHALRRRFFFVPMKADPNILRAYLSLKNPDMEWVADLLALLNRKLESEAKIEWSLHIGHSHFMKDNLDDARLRLIWEYSILPTLEEYFYRKGEEYFKAFSLDALKVTLGRT